jgi:cysteine desulfurase
VTGLEGRRVYLDWNATAPLRPEARAAMLAAMDAVGNPSSVHAEGRAAKAIVEKARGQVAGLVGCAPEEVVFTSGATEAAATVLAQDWDRVATTPFEHDAVAMAVPADATIIPDRLIRGEAHEGDVPRVENERALFVHQAASGETGAVFPYQVACTAAKAAGWDTFVDASQIVGRGWFNFSDEPATAQADFCCISAHKIGGPQGVGALIVRKGKMPRPLLRGGGQEGGRRSGTENVFAIAGFGAAADAAMSDDWDRVARLRDGLEETLASAAPDLHVFGKEATRLPNTSCFAVRGWKGETQVMQMDLVGFAVSAGSACSSGKVNKASRVLMAMGYDEEMASSAIRVSLGLTTTEAEVMAFAEAWIEHYRRRKARAA